MTTPHEDREGLAACPFCGSEAAMSHYGKLNGPDLAGYYVECCTCSAGGESFEIQGEMPDREEHTKSLAVAAWNTRASRPTSREGAGLEIVPQVPAAQDVGPILDALDRAGMHVLHGLIEPEKARQAAALLRTLPAEVAVKADLIRTMNADNNDLRAARVALSADLASREGEIATAVRKGLDWTERACVFKVERDDWKARAEAAEQQVKALEGALTPDANTKYAYIGEFSVPWPERDENGDHVVRQINVPWTTIKEIMAAIRARAALTSKPDGEG